MSANLQSVCEPREHTGLTGKSNPYLTAPILKKLHENGFIPTDLCDILESRGKQWAKTQVVREEAFESYQQLLHEFQKQCLGYGGGQEGWVRGEWNSLIYCPDTRPGGEMIFRTSRRCSEMYKALLGSVQGQIHPGVVVCQISDPTHPVRFSTHPDQSSFTLLYVGSTIKETANRVVFGEYTGEILNQNQIGDSFEYVFDLTFCKEAWRCPQQVFTQKTDSEDENFCSNTNLAEFEASMKMSTNSSPRTEGHVVNLPGARHFVLNSQNACNEMSLLNHHGVISPLGNTPNKKNCEWQQVFVDGWPHIILTSLPGVRIEPGDELHADFGNEWFFKVQTTALKSLRQELLEWRLGLRHGPIQSLPPGVTIEKIHRDKSENKYTSDFTCCGLCRMPDQKEIDPCIHCDDCDRPFHLRCLKRPEDIPEDKKWFCMYCVDRAMNILRSQQHCQFVKCSDTTCQKCSKKILGSTDSISKKCDDESETEKFQNEEINYCNNASYKSEHDSQIDRQFHNFSVQESHLRVYNRCDEKAKLCHIESMPLKPNPALISDETSMGLISSASLPPENLLGALKPCLNCFQKLGPKASVEVCRLSKRHLEGNWDHPDNDNPNTIRDTILTCYQLKLHRLQEELNARNEVAASNSQVSVSSNCDKTAPRSIKRKRTTTESRLVGKRRTQEWKEAYNRKLLQNVKTSGFVPIMGVHLGKTTFMTEFEDGWWVGKIMEYHPMSPGIEKDDPPFLTTLFQVLYNDGDTEWLQPEKILEILVEQTLFAHLFRRGGKYSGTTPLSQLLHPDLIQTRKLVNLENRLITCKAIKVESEPMDADNVESESI